MMESYRGATFHRVDVSQRKDGVLLSLTARTPDGVSLDITVLGENLSNCKQEVRDIVDRYLDSSERESLAAQLRVGERVSALGERAPELVDLCLKAAASRTLGLDAAVSRALELLEGGAGTELVQLQLSGEWGLVPSA
ncbi:MAG: hypothetical protein KDC10_10990 [Calditrichaeota bacterium]|nr:hypothetical protein [Candidatus Cloacimonadota bacterium]MCA9785151.1 hypothetical protein [Candidatus Cloacimonadota bacterium]MCB1047714.1 hypothetical protein [Calditrichota bacterium]MCB9472952.1 hypothetical protein [Candidatus Delongbacteria bacterium]